jgi:hypothetical protein
MNTAETPTGEMDNQVCSDCVVMLLTQHAKPIPENVGSMNLLSAKEASEQFKLWLRKQCEERYNQQAELDKQIYSSKKVPLSEKRKQSSQKHILKGIHQSQKEKTIKSVFENQKEKRQSMLFKKRIGDENSYSPASAQVRKQRGEELLSPVLQRNFSKSLTEVTNSPNRVRYEPRPDPFISSKVEEILKVTTPGSKQEHFLALKSPI